MARSLPPNNKGKKIIRRIPSNIPFGYLIRYNEITGEKYLKIDPEKGPIVKLLFELYSTNEYSILSLSNHILNKFNININTGTLNGLLKNPFYIGITRGKHLYIYEPLISPELFNKVTSLLKNNYGRRGEVLNTSMYQGLIKCNICKYAIRCNYNKQVNYVLYCCSKLINNHKNFYFRDQAINKLLNDILESLDIELALYFNSLSITEKRLLIRYLFESLELNEKELIYKLTNHSFKIDDVKNYIDHQIVIISKTKVKEIDESIEYDNIFLNHCKKPKTLDELINLTGLSLDEIQNQLMDLMLEGKIEEENGKWKTNG
jgi:hypothetical protein